MGFRPKSVITSVPKEKKGLLISYHGVPGPIWVLFVMQVIKRHELHPAVVLP